jgi:hypothetical protein
VGNFEVTSEKLNIGYENKEALPKSFSNELDNN